MTLTQQPVVIVRAEEALIVLTVLILWVAAIALFFNRWGKIRMLEPYQPKFIQQHRPSCPAALVDAVQQQRSFSKFNINGDQLLTQATHHRPRQNSVFVGSSMVTLPLHPPRKVKSAFDLQNLVLSDPALNRSIVRLNLARDEIRRSSMIPSFERAQCYTTDKPQERKRPESRNNSICSTTRRGSIFPDPYRNVLSAESDRTLLPPPIKSGVLDFRRNSMMIINNLAEDIAPSSFTRNFSLGGSNLNLVQEFPPSPRRNSVIPPYALPKKQKLTSMPNSTEKYITNQKASKSLDSEATAVRKLQPAVSELKRQFLNQTNSSETLATIDFPKIVETTCPSPIVTDDSDLFIFKAASEEPSSSRVNLLASNEVYYSSVADLKMTSPRSMTSSLTDLKVKSPINVVTTTNCDVNPSYKVTNV